jgi:hypothetical protein
MGRQEPCAAAGHAAPHARAPPHHAERLAVDCLDAPARAAKSRVHRRRRRQARHDRLAAVAGHALVLQQLRGGGGGWGWGGAGVRVAQLARGRGRRGWPGESLLCARAPRQHLACGPPSTTPARPRAAPSQRSRGRPAAAAPLPPLTGGRSTSTQTGRRSRPSWGGEVGAGLKGGVGSGLGLGWVARGCCLATPTPPAARPPPLTSPGGPPCTP